MSASDLISTEGRVRGRENIDYRCDECGTRKKRDELFVKHIQWRTMGKGPQTVRARVVAWVCGSCMKKYPDYNRTRFADAHGHAHTSIGRRAIMEKQPDKEKFDG